MSARDSCPFEQSIGAVLLKAKDAVVASLQPKLREHDITEQQWRVMRVIDEKGSSSATELAGACHLHMPSVVRILKEFVRRNFISCKRDHTDSRRMLVKLTSAGREVFEDISIELGFARQECLSLFGAERLEQLIAELRAFSVAIQRGERPAQSFVELPIHRLPRLRPGRD